MECAVRSRGNDKFAEDMNTKDMNECTNNIEWIPSRKINYKRLRLTLTLITSRL